MKQPEESAGGEITESGSVPASVAKLVEDVHGKVLARIPVDRIVESIDRLLSSIDRNGNPDARGIAAGVTLWTETLIGKPVQRQHIIQEKRTNAPPIEELLNSPAAVESLARALSRSEEGRAAMASAMKVVDLPK